MGGSIAMLTCVCGEKKEVPSRENNVGKMMDITGFSPVFTHDRWYWLCPQCVEKLKPYIEFIKNFFKDDPNLSWSGLRNLTRNQK